MKIHATLPVRRLMRHILPLLMLGPLVAIAAPPAKTATEKTPPPAADVETPPATDTDTDTELGASLTSDPDNPDGENLFDTLEDSETASESARYKYSVRYIKGNRRKLETVQASSEPLAYRKVRKKHPDADSILLIEIRRDGERVDRSRRESKSGRTIGGPLSGRRSRRSSGGRSGNRRRFNMLSATPEVPDSPFAKLIDQMHKQNTQNILRGKTFEDIEKRMQQARIELERRRQAAERYRRQALNALRGVSGSGGNKTPFSKGNKSNKPPKKKIGDSVKSGGKGKGKGGGPGGTGGGAAKPSSGGGSDSDIKLRSGLPVNPNF